MADKLKMFVNEGAWGIVSLSPYCTHVEAWARMAGIPYDREVAKTGSAPDKALPYGTVGSKVLRNPDVLRSWLAEQTDAEMRDTMSEADYALDTALSRMVAEHFVWCFLYSRWVYEPGWNGVVPQLREFVPPVIGGLLIGVFRSKIIKMIAGRGFPKSEEARVWRDGVQDVKTMSTVLGEGEWFVNDKPTGLDANIYSVLANVVHSPGDTPLKEAVNAHPNLLNFVKRVEETYFPGGEAEAIGTGWSPS
jgi:glutathione S-transferase